MVRFLFSTVANVVSHREKTWSSWTSFEKEKKQPKAGDSKLFVRPETLSILESNLADCSGLGSPFCPLPLKERE